jgi:replicative DNA helicase
MQTSDAALEKGLPANLDAERFVLGAILLDDSYFIEAASALSPEDFALEKHRRIFSRMSEIVARGERIDRITVANELMKHNQLEACDGLAYLVALDDGLPQVFTLGSYLRIVKDKSTLRRIIVTSQKLIDRCLIAQEEPDQILADAEDSLLKLGEQRQTDRMATPREIIEDFQGGLNAFLDPARRVKGVPTGFLKFDEMTGGLRGGELFILAARPSMGKTALALNIAQNIVTSSEDPRPVAVFSLEMSSESLLTRMTCAAARVDQQKFRMGYLSRDERNALQEAAFRLTEAPLYIDDTPGCSLMDVHAKLRRLQNEQKIGLVIIDYLQLMSSKGKQENRNQEVSALSRGLKLLAMEMDVPFLVLSQLSRAPETRPGDHKPQMSDLRESGSIEQDADLIGFIYREEVYKPDREDLRGLADLMLSKQRNGPTGTVKLVFLRQFTRFENRLDDIGDDNRE